ncbi:hypothetical protein F4680DRAFT_427106 [Xylaria scruposa]|nr:hypothetical protein F4680DRAFT_427106 [Xylaria scruposa]
MFGLGICVFFLVYCLSAFVAVCGCGYPGACLYPCSAHVIKDKHASAIIYHLSFPHCHVSFFHCPLVSSLFPSPFPHRSLLSALVRPC